MLGEACIMEKKVFHVGSVGIGGISQGVHLPGIHKSPDLELVAVCDLKPERMEYARNTYGIREDQGLPSIPCEGEKSLNAICTPYMGK